VTCQRQGLACAGEGLWGGCSPCFWGLAPRIVGAVGRESSAGQHPWLHTLGVVTAAGLGRWLVCVVCVCVCVLCVVFPCEVNVNRMAMKNPVLRHMAKHLPLAPCWRKHAAARAASEANEDVCCHSVAGRVMHLAAACGGNVSVKVSHDSSDSTWPLKLACACVGRRQRRL
jgi:hypothetical protein